MTKEIQYPPSYCEPLCDNGLNDLCFEVCEKMSQFVLKKGLDIRDMPRFPIDEYLTTMDANERKIIMGVYMAKTIDFVQGRTGDPNVFPEDAHRRPQKN